MNKSTTALCFGSILAATAASATVSVTNVIVRQQWPWSTDVRVEYAVAGATASDAVDVSFEAYAGTTDLGPIPTSALKGSHIGIAADDSYVVTFSPANVPCLSTKTALENFVVKATTSASAAANLEKLYAIVDLKTASNVTYVTRADLLNGKYGTYETAMPWITGSSVITNAGALPIIWTGVTNNPIYSTDYLVLRHIPAGPFMMGGKGSPWDDFKYHSVTLTNDYWIGVFELTQQQYYNITKNMSRGAYFSGGDPSYTDRCARRPVENLPWNGCTGMRGDPATAAYNWPTGREIDPDSVCGKISALTGWAFDLPTEAQWEYACRAGTTTAWNNGAELDGTKGSLDPAMLTLQRAMCNGGVKQYYLNADNLVTASVEWAQEEYIGPTGGTAIVGSYLPNAWGLYDMHGNVWETCRDWYSQTYYVDYCLQGITEPEGPSTGSGRMIRGGDYGIDSSQYWNNSYMRYGANPNAGQRDIGFRLYAPFKATGSN